jgi:hypothetical protein
LLTLAFLACTDPFSFEPGDPTKPDPPAPPRLTSPPDSWCSDNYGYPQSVTFTWQPIPGPVFYQFEAYDDWTPNQQNLIFENKRVASTTLKTSFYHYGRYCWRVRAASREWNDYTDWSGAFRFALPSPAR